MKRKRIAMMLAILLIVSGCTVAGASQEEPKPTFSSAGISEAASSKNEESSIKIHEDKEETTSILQEKKSKTQEKTETAASKQTAAPKTPASETPGATIQPTPKTVPEPSKETITVKEPDPPAPDPEPEVIVQEPVHEEPVPIREPEPKPKKACPGGKNEDLGCEVILDTNYYRETFSSAAEAIARGQYYMDEVMYIGDFEITSYSVQEVYRNDHSIAYYGLNLWSSGSLIH